MSQACILKINDVLRYTEVAERSRSPDQQDVSRVIIAVVKTLWVGATELFGNLQERWIS
jgi:hypothetical protein